MFEDFDKVFVVGLDRRGDRRQEFDSFQWPFDYEYHSAVDGQLFNEPSQWTGGKGGWGCFLSHLQILEKQIQNGWEKVFIFEDDAIPAPNFLEETSRFFQMLPSNWHQIYLGGLHRYTKEHPPTPVNMNVVKCNQVNWTHAYGVTLPYARKLHQYLWESFAEHPGNYHIDWRYEVLHSKHNVYAPTSWTVYQGKSASDVLKSNRVVKMKGKQTLHYLEKLEKNRNKGFGFIMITGDSSVNELANSLRNCNTQITQFKADVDKFVATHNPYMDEDVLVRDIAKLMSTLLGQQVNNARVVMVHEGLLPYVPYFSQVDPDIRVVDFVGKKSDNGPIRKSVYGKVGTNFRYRFEQKGSFETNYLKMLDFLGLNITNRMLSAEVRRSENWYGDQD